MLREGQRESLLSWKLIACMVEYIEQYYLFTVPKFAISQSEANSTVLISYDIKSLTWYPLISWSLSSKVMLRYDKLQRGFSPWVFWPWVFFRHGYFGSTVSRQNTNHGSTKLAWYAAEAYQKGTIRYIYWVHVTNHYWNWVAMVKRKLLLIGVQRLCQWQLTFWFWATEKKEKVIASCLSGWSGSLYLIGQTKLIKILLLICMMNMMKLCLTK